ncbi:MAG: hypothetical protein HBSAPP04_24340 [Ignavibacteriaceae bacterium]|nr:MAG: hypothetical protein HBSAPP04_24340 [Ignavibacteriaceae bacterium]
MIYQDKNISILLIEDEEFDVRRVKNTVAPFEDKMQIVNFVSNGKAALDYLADHKDTIDIVIMDYQISGGLKIGRAHV